MNMRTFIGQWSLIIEITHCLGALQYGILTDNFFVIFHSFHRILAFKDRIRLNNFTNK